jgi:hypothetical protein
MRNGLRERIESELSDAIECGLATEEALAEAAGLLTEAEELVSRLSAPARPRRKRTRKRRKEC